MNDNFDYENDREYRIQRGLQGHISDEPEYKEFSIIDEQEHTFDGKQHERLKKRPRDFEAYLRRQYRFGIFRWSLKKWILIFVVLSVIVSLNPQITFLRPPPENWTIYELSISYSGSTEVQLSYVTTTNVLIDDVLMPVTTRHYDTLPLTREFTDSRFSFTRDVVIDGVIIESVTIRGSDSFPKNIEYPNYDVILSFNLAIK